MLKYSNYIALSPYYESVVDIESETRNPNLWQEYIVHEDMREALDKICMSLKYEDKDKRRSFWIHGAYGTGKSYAAIVLKHLFEDNVDSVESFLSKEMLIPYRERFLSLRRKGEFLVIWKSQAGEIRSGTELLMTMETAIRDKLREKFGEDAYFGRNSLSSAAKDAVKDSSVNWEYIFRNSDYRLDEEYDSFSDFKQEVLNGSIAAARKVAGIYRNKGWGLFDSLAKFKAWVADVIDGNHLRDTGIIFIWDEFTSYLRTNPNDDTLQPLSEFCKEQPFFMFLIVHRAESWIKDMGEEVYERITHRFHSLNFHVSEHAAYELIANSLKIRPGMASSWEDVKNELMRRINPSDFDLLEMTDKRAELRGLCPFHPMTLSLLAVVAQNFAAAERTIFRFMKDPQASENNTGFLYFINNYEPDGDWRWLTPDFLWDYFFTSESDILHFSAEAQSAYRHFTEKRDSISGDHYMRVFKAAMLLIALMSSGSIGNLYSRTVSRKISATRNTLYKCFTGQLKKEDVDTYLAALKEIGVISIDETANDARIQIPYSGKTDVFNVRKKLIIKNNSRHSLLKKNGSFARSIEAKLWDKNRASFGRMIVAACDSATQSVNLRFAEVQTDLQKYPYKFGVLAIVISEASQFTGMYEKVKELAKKDTTGRLAVCVLQSALTENHLDRWYNAMTHKELAGEEGKTGDASRYEEEADTIIEEWSVSAAEGQIMAAWKEIVYPCEYGAGSLASKIERDILFGKVFTSAPELIVSTTTAYKKVQQSVVLLGIQKTSKTAQDGNIANGLRNAKVWDMDTIEKLAEASGNEGAAAVGRLANFIQGRFSQGTRIRLDALWSELQGAPFGCYNCMACGYILGFVMRYYVNSQYTWNKGDNNTWLFTEQNLSLMISAMLKEETVNGYISPGSEVWQKFKPYVQNIFRLSDSEAVNEIEARKYIARQCISVAGVPFWVLKYADAEKFGGVSAKGAACEIVDMLCDFLTGSGDSEQLMNDITTKFAGRGNLRKTLEDLYFDRDTAFGAFGAFVDEKCPELQGLREKIGLSGRELFDSIRQMMQVEVSTWAESQVEDKLSELCLEYRAIYTLNDALGLKHKSMRRIGEDIANALRGMKIPASVIGKMGYAWFGALKAMHEVSVSAWSRLALNTREEYVKIFGEGAREAWGCVESSRPILQKYMDMNGHNCTEEELEDIYTSLRACGYDFPAGDFDARIGSQLNKIAYTRNKIRLQELWQERSGFVTVSEWCSHFAVPIQWVASDEALQHIAVLKTVQDGRMADSTALSNAVKYFEANTLEILRDKKYIDEHFIVEIGNTYRKAFEESGDVLISRLKTNPKLTADVYSWAHKTGEIRKILDDFLRGQYRDKAKMNVQSMAESELRSRVIKLLDDNPDLYTLFIN